MNRLQHLHQAGVSIWLDVLSRDLLDSGEFARMIDAAQSASTTARRRARRAGSSLAEDALSVGARGG